MIYIVHNKIVAEVYVYMNGMDMLFNEYNGGCCLQALHNVFRTNETNADAALASLKATVEKKFIPYKQSE